MGPPRKNYKDRLTEVVAGIISQTRGMTKAGISASVRPHPVAATAKQSIAGLKQGPVSVIAWATAASNERQLIVTGQRGSISVVDGLLSNYQIEIYGIDNKKDMIDGPEQFSEPEEAARRIVGLLKERRPSWNSLLTQ